MGRTAQVDRPQVIEAGRIHADRVQHVGYRVDHRNACSATFILVSPQKVQAIKPYRFDSLKKTGGDDRIRTCGTLLEYNGLANRRFQPLSHVSELSQKSQVLILSAMQTLSRFIASNSPMTLVFSA